MTPLIVASYNIHRGVGLDRRRDLDRIAKVIAEMAPDVVGLQEVVRENGVADADQARYLAGALGMSVVMGETRPFGDGTYGNAVQLGQVEPARGDWALIEASELPAWIPGMHVPKMHRRDTYLVRVVSRGRPLLALDFHGFPSYLPLFALPI